MSLTKLCTAFEEGLKVHTIQFLEPIITQIQRMIRINISMSLWQKSNWFTHQTFGAKYYLNSKKSKILKNETMTEKELDQKLDRVDRPSDNFSILTFLNLCFIFQ